MYWPDLLSVFFFFLFVILIHVLLMNDPSIQSFELKKKWKKNGDLTTSIQKDNPSY